ncbi:hypothetical protein O1611_g6340 [Lasiodiplodia mahajangana]|uniref:Uncharacterized protein n=1 Tax=Lasiodiplodia mahajangana TaxID=1108764 RepID=A0ACC2JJD1_9PEZI|nr:hypothetical protein O1611_g6340 [Lasiodiplodia mahajangana]
MSSPKAFLQINPQIETSHSGNEKSLAFSTARTRWPRIIAWALIDVHQTSIAPERTELERKDGNLAESELRQLLSELGRNQDIRPLRSDGASDIASFNAELKFLGRMTWYHSPWLFTECYLYRFIQTCFSRRKTRFWIEYDVFGHEKNSSLRGAKTSVVELVQFLDTAINASQADAPVNKGDPKALFEEMLQTSLWGNSEANREARQLFKRNVVDDDTEIVWSLLSGFKHAERHREIHVVLNNAGIELIADLVFVVYLLDANYASKVVLHGKAFPWFVSHATVHDLKFTMQTLQNASFDGEVAKDEASKLKRFGTRISQHLHSGQLRYKAHSFWTTQHGFARMPEHAPDLWAQLGRSDLVIFKGDLNYRKLVMDGLWPCTTTFQRAIGKLGQYPTESETGIRILSLRTCKADTVVGLAAGKEKEVDPEGTGEWTRDGKFAVISYYDGKS